MKKIISTLMSAAMLINVFTPSYALIGGGRLDAPQPKTEAELVAEAESAVNGGFKNLSDIVRQDMFNQSIRNAQAQYLFQYQTK